MGDVGTYLMMQQSQLDPVGWVLFVLQIGVLVGGAYLVFIRRDGHPVRGPALRRLGIPLLVLGVVGTLLGILAAAVVAPFTMPVWLVVVTLFEVVLAIVAAVYQRTTYAEQVAQMQSGQPVRRAGAPRPAISASGPASGQSIMFDDERGMGTRRGARRERKRRKR